MKYDLWISVMRSEQLTEKVLSSGKLIIPFYKSDDFASKLPLNKGYYVSLPFVVRNKDADNIKQFLETANNDERVLGVFVHNTETLGLIRHTGFLKPVILGPGMYIWNNASASVFEGDCTGFVYPYELSKHELKEISSDKGILTVYGRTPLMITSNCTRNTKKKCLKGKGPDFEFITDRKGSNLPVFFECTKCYNMIFNPVPSSLHDYLKEVYFTDSFLLNFTDEEETIVDAILDFYCGKTKTFPITNTTKAYFVHGVE